MRTIVYTCQYCESEAGYIHTSLGLVCMSCRCLNTATADSIVSIPMLDSAQVGELERMMSL